jgi:isopentenyl phosphate kinase
MDSLHTSELLFLKLGGSLITDKTTPRSPLLERIGALAQEIKAACAQNGEMQLLLGHGSGSFGHVPASKYGTRQGVHSPDDWRGFAEVWYEASTLNRILVDVFYQAGLPVVTFPVSGSVVAMNGQVVAWNLGPLTAALQAGLLPVVYGDVVFDQVRAGTILSTEDIFTYLARELHPRRILLAGIDRGVWADFPDCTSLIPEINAQNWDAVASVLGGSAATDVTGGMRTKVRTMLDLALQIPGLEINIFSGLQSGSLRSALQGQPLGTRISSKP